MSWVLDCSMAMSFVLPDENDTVADAFMAAMGDDYSVRVPPLWWYEVANVLAVNVRRGRLSVAQCETAMNQFHLLPIQTDIGLGDTTFFRNGQLAAAHGLSAYDATYLELAMRRSIGLASLDEPLCRIAQKLGIHVFRA